MPSGRGGCSPNLYHLEFSASPVDPFVGLKLEEVGKTTRGREGESVAGGILSTVESDLKLLPMPKECLSTPVEGKLVAGALFTGDRLDGCSGPGRAAMAGRLAAIRRG